MIQALAAILGAALTSGACYAGGILLLGKLGVKLNRAERAPLSFILGAACLHLAVFAVLLLHLAYWPIFVLLLTAPIAIVLFRSRLASSAAAEPKAPGVGAGLSKTLRRLSIVLFGAFTVLYFFHALAPESSPDGSTYHLGFVARYLRAHGFERVEDMYAALSGGVETVFTPAFAIGKHSAAALTHFAFLIALALAVFAYGQRLGKPWPGAAAAFLVYASPVVGVDGTSAYIDVAVAAVVFAVFYWLEIWDELRDERLLIPAGLLAGYAYAAKYTAFVMFFYAIGFVVWRSRSFRPALRLSACAFLMAGPWILKDWVLFQNPVAPFAGVVFRDSHFHAITIQQWASYLHRYEIANLWSLPLEVTVRGGKTASVIGPVFLLAPVFLLSLRFRPGRRLLAAGLLLLTTYLANVGTRFLIPELPFFALALALAPGDSPGLVACLAIFHAITSWPQGVAHYAPGAWRLPGRVLYREALRMVPQDRYLRAASPAYSLARLTEDHVPKGERVLDLAGIADAYTSREALGYYHSAFNDDLTDMLNTGWLDSNQPRLLEQFSFPERMVSRIRVEQVRTARPGEQWSIHELRFFYRGRELTRMPAWSLSAWPNPWDVQLAFDASPATRWRTWEEAAPGDYMQVDFGRPQAVNEARIETSYDDQMLQGTVKLWDEASRRWLDAGGDRRTSALRPEANVRRYATREIALHGVRYLLIPDEFQGSFDLRGDPEGWGLELTAQGYGARLYHIVP